MRHAQCARLAGSALAALFLLAGCKDDPSDGNRVPTAIVTVSGNQQTGQAGIALGQPIVLRVTDARGGIPEITVTFALPQTQGGILSPSTAVTDANGEVQTSWTLGGQVGAQTFTATVSGVSPVTLQATAAAGPATSIVALTETTQFVVVGRTVPIQPSVRVADGFGNSRSGETVTFSVGQTGGRIAAGSTTKITDANGRATVEGWQIDLAAGLYTLRAEIAGAVAAVFNAHGVPATVQAFAGTPQSANAGTQVAQAPSVIARRDDGQPLADVPVTFEVTQGGGFVTGAAQTTGADGLATVGRWVLGLTPGDNRLEGRVLGVAPPAVFAATGVQATPTSIAPTSAATQSGFFGNFVSAMPEVTARDGSGSPVAGVGVAFEVTEGGGILVGASTVTDFLGRAAPAAWRLGSDVNHSVRATAGSLAPVTFTATAAAAPSSEYHIDVRFLSGPPSPAQQAAFDAAAGRWQSVIIGDLADITIDSLPASSFGCYPALLNEFIDDVRIYANLIPIDGPGSVLGRAGPCLIRTAGKLSVVGLMEFDTADLAMLETNGRLNDVITHEMGHVLGFGTLWTDLSLIQGRGGSNPTFTGSSARGAFLAAVLGGSTFTGSPVPVENTGGPGTRDSHWREATVSTELMTGIYNGGVANPLSAFSLASLRDMGYLVNDAVADPFTFQAQLLGGFGGQFRLTEEPLRGPIIEVDRHGRETGRIPRLY